MERFMPVWILIIALLSVAATALLTSILMRVNAPARRNNGGDGGGDMGAVATVRSGRDNDGRSDGGPDGGGGD